MSVTHKANFMRVLLVLTTKLIHTNNIYQLALKVISMDTAKLFQTGRSQAVRLPKAFRMPGSEVKIRRDGDKIILEPIKTSWQDLLMSLNEFPADFMKGGREQPDMQERDDF